MSGYQPSAELRVAKPCGESWEAMSGGSRVRHCGSCDRDVLNVAAMTPAQVEAVIAEGTRTGTMPCMRMVRDAAGALILAQEVVRPKWYQRVAAGAGVTLLSTLAAAAQQAKPAVQTRLSGHLVDISGASIPQASVSFRREDGVVFRATTDGAGQFVVDAAPGTYEMDADSPGFSHYVQKEVVLKAGEQVLDQDVRLQVDTRPWRPVAEQPVVLRIEERSTASLLFIIPTPPLDAKMPVLRGRVVDPLGVPIPGATIELHSHRDQFDARVLRAMTDDDGAFAVDAPAGEYDVSAKMPGFDHSAPGSVRLERGVRELDKPILLHVGMVEMGEVVSVPLKTHKGKKKPVAAAPAVVATPVGHAVSVELGEVAVTERANDMPVEARGTASLLAAPGTVSQPRPMGMAAPDSTPTPAPR